jgi:hypothetical protein
MSVAPLLVLLTCLVGSVSYIGAVTQSALAAFVLPTVILVGVAALRLRFRTGPALAMVVVLSGSLGEAVNIASGQFQGSVARSAGVAGLATGAALVLSATRRPALFLLPVAAIVAWALALGAGARVELVAVVTAGVALVTLAALERDLRLFVKAPRTTGSVLLAVLLVVAVGVVAAQYQLHHDARPAASPFRQTLATTIEPPAFLSLTKHPPPSATNAAAAVPSPVAAPPNHHPRLRQLARELLWGLLGLVVLLFLGLVSRLLWVSLAWRRMRRRLLRSVESSEAGAWAWTLATLDRLGSPVAAHISPDVAMSDAVALSGPVRVLAAAVAPAVFAPVSGAVPALDAWRQAKAAVEDAWGSASQLRRLRAHWRTPRRSTRAH